MNGSFLPLSVCAVIACSAVHATPVDAVSSDAPSALAGNTIAVLNRHGTSLIYFHPDGRFEHHSPKGRASQGRWHASNDEVCTTAADAAGTMKTHCLPIGGRTLGSTWSGGADPRNGGLSYQWLAGHPGFDAVPGARGR